jgi:hypothetical protein
MGWTTKESGFDSQWGQEIFLMYNVQTGSGAHPATYTVGHGGCFPKGKWQGHEADHSPTSNAEVKNGGAILSLPHTSSWHGV